MSPGIHVRSSIFGGDSSIEWDDEPMWSQSTVPVAMWHVHDSRDADDGWVVLAQSPEEARRKVIDERRRSFEVQLAAMRQRDDLYAWTRDATDEAVRRWYYWGVNLTPESPDPDTQVGEATPVPDGIFAIPFLGYSW